MFRAILGVVAVTLSILGCAGAGQPVEAGLLGVVERMGDNSVPTVQAYETSRTEFLAIANGIIVEQERRSNSSVARIKKVIASLGTALGLGGTVASFVVNNDDTRATISQWSAAIAGVSGIFGLLPLGGDTKAAEGITRYLALELPRFEARWPAMPGQSPSAAEWGEFKGRRMPDIERSRSVGAMRQLKARVPS